RNGDESIGRSSVDLFHDRVPAGLSSLRAPGYIRAREIGGRKKSYARPTQIQRLAALIDDPDPSNGRPVAGAIGILFQIAARVMPRYTTVVRSKNAKDMIVRKTNDDAIGIVGIDRDTGDERIGRKHRTGNLQGRGSRAIRLIEPKDMPVAGAII